MKLAPLLISTRDSSFEKGCSLVATALPRDRQGATQTCQCSTRFPCQAHPRLPRLASHWCLHMRTPGAPTCLRSGPMSLNMVWTSAPVILRQSNSVVLFIACEPRGPQQQKQVMELLKFLSSNDTYYQ